MLESRLGHDFSGVRVRADAKAAVAAGAIHARAYTAGRNVVFGAGQYSPATVTGQNLLAHELTHVVQQQAAAPKSGSPPDSIRTADAGGEPLVIQRQPLATKEEMVQGVRELEVGLKSHLPGPPLDEATHQLTNLQRRALEENVRRVITKSIPAARKGDSSVSAIAAQIANPRFRFLSQVPPAKAALIDALKSIGMRLSAGW